MKIKIYSVFIFFIILNNVSLCQKNYGEYLKLINIDENTLDNTIYTTKKFIKINDSFKIKVFKIKSRVTNSIFENMIILFEINSTVNIIGLLPSYKSIYEISSFYSPKKINKKRVPILDKIDSSGYAYFYPPYDSVVFIKNKFLSESDLNLINSNINFILNDTINPYPINNPERANLDSYTNNDQFVFQLKIDNKILTLYIQGDCKSIQFQEIIKLLNAKLNE